jgi:DNA-binding response OmpR family regulator
MENNILIVDDDAYLLNVLVLILRTEGYHIETSLSGEVLLKKMLYNPDLIILDRQLSDLDGAEICKGLKKEDETKNIPVILISAGSGLRDIAKDAGADDYIEKPFDSHELRDKVKHMLSKRKCY